MKCSCPSFVAPSRSAIIPASTHTAFNCAPLNSSVLRASSSKLTSGPVAILREWISRIRARAVSCGSGNSILRSSRPERRSAGSRMSIRFVAAMTWTAYQYNRRRPNVLTCLDPFIAAEAIELVEELKHCALHFPITTLIRVEPLGAYCIKLVDENDRRCLFLRKLECVTDELGPITDEHLH